MMWDISVTWILFLLSHMKTTCPFLENIAESQIDFFNNSFVE